MNTSAKEFARKLKSGSPLAYYGTVVLLIGLVATLLLMLIDSTQIGGINRWIKPSKFFLSIAVYVATMGWLLRSVSSVRFRNRMNLAILVTMASEALIITFQAARGVQSHFNQTSLFDGVLYGIMGVSAIVQIPIALILLLRLSKEASLIDPLYLRGIQFGLIAFILACIEGAFMSVYGSHTVGAPDGGSGLAFVSWSLRHGDLRIAHFVGMHALQLFPLLGCVLSQTNRSKTLLMVSAVLFIAANLALFMQALAGYSIVSIFS